MVTRFRLRRFFARNAPGSALSRSRSPSRIDARDSRKCLAKLFLSRCSSPGCCVLENNCYSDRGGGGTSALLILFTEQEIGSAFPPQLKVLSHGLIRFCRTKLSGAIELVLKIPSPVQDNPVCVGNIGSKPRVRGVG